MIYHISEGGSILNKTSYYQQREEFCRNQIQEENTLSSVKTDSVEIGKNTSSVIAYSKSSAKKLNTDEIASLKAMTEKATDVLRNYVKKLLLYQGSESINNAGECNYDDANYGIESTSDRIVSFAIAVSGNDTGKLSELKDAIDKGFAEARKSFGGELPEICNQTYNKIMEKLDAWSKTTSES